MTEDIVILNFEDSNIKAFYKNDKLHLEAESVAKAVGYAKTSSLLYHFRENARRIVDVDGYDYFSLASLKFLVARANRTPAVARIYSWAKEEQKRHNVFKDFPTTATPVVQQVVDLSTPDDELIGITEAAEEFGMYVSDFVLWLIRNEWASRFSSNGNIRWNENIRLSKFGTLPVLPNGQSSNVAKLTKKGMSTIKMMMEMQRADGVLSFADQAPYVADAHRRILENVIREEFENTLPTDMNGMFDGIERVIKRMES